MEALKELYSGLNCASVIEDIATTYPDSIEKLVTLHSAILKDIEEKGAKIEAALSSRIVNNGSLNSADVASQSNIVDVTVKPEQLVQTPEVVPAMISSIPTLPGPALCILREVNCLTPKKKCDIYVGEWGIGIECRTKNVVTGLSILLVSELQNASILQVRDKNRESGTYQTILIALKQPVPLEKSSTNVFAFSETYAAAEKQGAIRVPFLRSPDRDFLHHPELFESTLAPNSMESRSLWGSDVVLEFSNEIVALRSILTAIFGKLSEPDRMKFVSSAAESYVKCYHKVSDGLLFPMRKGLIFTGRPIMYISLMDVAAINVSRGGQDVRSFDLVITLTNAKKVMFSMISSQELEAFRAYVGSITIYGAIIEDTTSKPKKATANAPAAAAAIADNSEGVVRGADAVLKTETPQTSNPAQAVTVGVSSVPLPPVRRTQAPSDTEDDDDDPEDQDFDANDSGDSEDESGSEFSDDSNDSDDDSDSDDSNDDSDSDDSDEGAKKKKRSKKQRQESDGTDSDDDEEESEASVSDEEIEYFRNQSKSSGNSDVEFDDLGPAARFAARKRARLAAQGKE